MNDDQEAKEAALALVKPCMLLPTGCKTGFQHIPAIQEKNAENLLMLIQSYTVSEPQQLVLMMQSELSQC